MLNDILPLASPPDRERFIAKIDFTPSCWNWNAALFSNQYGAFKMRVGDRFKQCKAHRVSYQWTHGPIPDGLTLDHLCRNTKCVNPAHLEVVTMRVNVLRGTSPIARNALKTQCKRGHELSGDNLLTRSDGSRVCRECANSRPGKKAYQKRYWAANKERLTAYIRNWRQRKEVAAV